MTDLDDRATVVIVDDDLPIRQDFGRLLEHDGRLRVVGYAHDGLDAVETVGRLKPDLAVMDVRMPQMTGIEATRIITETTDTAVLVVTTFDLDRDVLAAIKAGAAGFLLKAEAAAQLADASVTVVDGGQLYNPVATRLLVEHLTAEQPAGLPALDRFTERELTVLMAVATGRSNDEVAGELSVSVATVRAHMRAILAKIGATNRTQAVVWAYENRVVRPGG